MAIEIISKLKPKNNADFKLIDASDIEYSDFTFPLDSLKKATDYADDVATNALIEAKKYVDQKTGNIGDIGENTGISDTAKSLILALFASAAYSNPDIETQYNALKEEWSDKPKEYCSVTYNLSNISSSNINLRVQKGLSYRTNLSVLDGYEFSSVVVTMGGTDVTSTVYTSIDKQITIQSVTGDVVITAIASEKVIPVDKIELSQTSASMNTGDMLTLTATITPANATNKSINWSSNSDSVRVSSSGVVNAISAGNAVITAKTNNGKTATCQITVTAVVIPVQSISFAESSGTTTVGKIIKLTPVITPSNATDKTITWKSNKEAVATVSNGSVTALTAGEVIITATAGEKSATYTLTVEKPAISTEGLLYDLPTATTFSHENGSYVDTGVKLFDDISTKKNYTILCDVTAGDIIAAPDIYCLYHCMEESGNYPGLSASIWKDGNIGVNLYGSSKNIYYGPFTTKGMRSKFVVVIDQSKYAIYPSSISELTSVSKYNTNVDKNLILGAYQNSNGTKGRYFDGTINQFTVYNRVLTDSEIEQFTSEGHISLDITSKTIKNGESFTLVVTKTGIDKNISWKSSNTGVVTVDDGIVSAVGVGNATVYANAGEYYTRCEVTVEESDSSTEDVTCLYKLDLPKIFVHDDGTCVDTGVKLFENITESKPEYTILIDQKGGDNLTAANDSYCMLHCMEESGNYPGLSAQMLSTGRLQMSIFGSRYTLDNSLDKIKTRRAYAIEIRGGQYRINTGGSFSDWTTILNYNTNVAKSLLIGGYQDSDGIKGRYWDGTVYRFEVWKGFVNEDTITEWLSKAVDDTSSPDDDDTCVYSLPSETTFTPSEGKFVDTGIKLFESVDTSKPTWTILYDIDFGSDIQSKADTYCAFHCMEETSPWNGLSAAIWAKGSFGLNIYGTANDISGTKAVAGTRIKGGLIISESSFSLSSTVSNKATTSIKNYSGNIDKTLILGAYQTSTGTKGRFFNGTFHRFKVYNRVLTTEEINTFIAG